MVPSQPQGIAPLYTGYSAEKPVYSRGEACPYTGGLQRLVPRLVILSAAKNCLPREIFRCAQNDKARMTGSGTGW